MSEQLLIYSKEVDAVVTIYIGISTKIPPWKGYLLFPENQVLMGTDLYNAYKNIINDSNKLQKLFARLEVIHKKELKESLK